VNVLQADAVERDSGEIMPTGIGIGPENEEAKQGKQLVTLLTFI